MIGVHAVDGERLARLLQNRLGCGVDLEGAVLGKPVQVIVIVDARIVESW